MRVVIIGNGIAGVTAARHIRKRDSKAEITIISGETDFFFSRTALMYVFMGHMKFEHTKPYEDWFWEKNRIQLKKAWVEQVDTEHKTLIFSGGDQLNYDKLILATGSRTKTYNWPGQELKGVQGLYSKQDLELLEQNAQQTTTAVIVGGGLIGVELAEMLHSRGIAVHVLIREGHFWGNVLPKEEANLIARHLQQHGIKLHFNTELKEIHANEMGSVASVLCSDGKTIEAQLVGLTTGVTPNIEFLKASAIECGIGVLVNEFMETNIPDVYAIGDCAEFVEAPKGRKKIEQVWYTGRMMGESLAATICGEPTSYNPGPWFDSAKFFDLEYQTYGIVEANLKEQQLAFYWQNALMNQCFKVVFEKGSENILGINVIGIRLRHEMMDSWLKSGIDMHFLMEHLVDLNFNPELSKDWIKEVHSQYTKDFNRQVRSRKKSWANILKFSS